jgi:hypothetical protein
MDSPENPIFEPLERMRIQISVDVAYRSNNITHSLAAYFSHTKLCTLIFSRHSSWHYYILPGLNELGVLQQPDTYIGLG